MQNPSGCVDSISYSIDVIDPPIVTTVTSPDYCEQSDGVIQIDATGGKAPYSYSIDAGPVQPDSVFTGLISGEYIVSLTDAMGCEIEQSVTIDSAGGPVVDDMQVQDAHCSQADGVVDIVATSAVSSLRYAINGGLEQSVPQFTSLLPGDYTLSVTDTFGCESTAMFVVESLPGPVIETIVITAAHCNVNDGEIEVMASGGAGLQYAIDNGAYGGVSQFTDLEAGDHIISVLDAYGCITDSVVTIGMADGPSIEQITTTPAHCGMSDGTIELSASGEGPLAYALDNGVYLATGQFAGLASGDHNISVRDAFGCTKDTVVRIDVADGPQIDEIISVDAHCDLPDGAIEIIASGGTGALSYAINGGVSTAVPQFSDLIAGAYEVAVRDTTGCSVKQLVDIANLPGVQITTVETTDASCEGTGGEVTVGTEFGDGVMYSADGVDFQTDASLADLDAGVYWIYAQDQYGCRDSLSVSIEQPLPEIEGVSSKSAGCTGEEGMIVVSYYASKGPFTFSLDGINYQASHIFDGLEAGDYTVIVRNESGCALRTDVEVPALPFHVFGSITTTAASCGESDGVVELVPDVAIVDYSFDGMAVIPGGTYRDLAMGPYDLIYTDTSGCGREQLVIVTEAECGIYIPNVFSPNGDGVNDVFSPFYTQDRYALESFRIFDRWGSTILDCTNPCSWDGSAGSQDAESGVYLYVLILKSMDDETIRRSGDVTLIR